MKDNHSPTEQELGFTPIDELFYAEPPSAQKGVLSDDENQKIGHTVKEAHMEDYEDLSSYCFNCVERARQETEQAVIKKVEAILQGIDPTPLKTLSGDVAVKNILNFIEQKLRGRRDELEELY